MTTKTLSRNAIILDGFLQLHTQYISNDASVNTIAKYIGWGWHRTNNTLIELGYK